VRAATLDAARNATGSLECGQQRSHELTNRFCALRCDKKSRLALASPSFGASDLQTSRAHWIVPAAPAPVAPCTGAALLREHRNFTRRYKTLAEQTAGLGPNGCGLRALKNDAGRVHDNLGRHNKRTMQSDRYIVSLIPNCRFLWRVRTWRASRFNGYNSVVSGTQTHRVRCVVPGSLKDYSNPNAGGSNCCT
jgi:hypothetical protein